MKTNSASEKKTRRKNRPKVVIELEKIGKAFRKSCREATKTIKQFA